MSAPLKIGMMLGVAMLALIWSLAYLTWGC